MRVGWFARKEQPVSLSLVDQVTRKIRAGGGRMTGQRQLILEAVERHPNHPSAEEIYAIVRQADPAVNLSTVYRTLRWLEENGFIASRWFEYDGRRERFDTAPADRSQAEHFHFRCRSCSQIIEFDTPAIDSIRQSFQQSSGARVDAVNLTFYGLCPACQAVELDR